MLCALSLVLITFGLPARSPCRRGTSPGERARVQERGRGRVNTVLCAWCFVLRVSCCFSPAHRLVALVVVVLLLGSGRTKERGRVFLALCLVVCASCDVLCDPSSYRLVAFVVVVLLLGRGRECKKEGVEE